MQRTRTPKPTKRTWTAPLEMLEQAPIFLAALTIFSFLVDAKVGGILAFVYVFFLWLYPFVFGKGYVLFVSTLPRYFAVEYMVISVFITALRTESAVDAVAL